MSARPVPLKFQIGQRTLLQVARHLVEHDPPLADILSAAMPVLDTTVTDMDGYRLRSIPLTILLQVEQLVPGWIVSRQQEYPRHYITMAGNSFDAYWAGFSGKTRSTLGRKARKLAEACGGALDVRTFSSADDVDEFLALAQPLSALTYQERLLDAGLPTSPDAVAAMRTLAASDNWRGFVLCRDGQAISYLHLPVRDNVLIYAYLGYHPEHAAWSPGTVLQIEAMKALFAEGRFTHFDFTQGDGSHKALFATGNVACADVLLLRPRLSNRALVTALTSFDESVALAAELAERSGAKARLRRILRG